MNDQDLDNRMSALFHDTTARLDPDVSGLVRGGIDRGRSRRRRSTLGTTLAAVAAIGAVGAVASVVPDLGSGTGPAGQPAGQPAVAPATTARSTTAPATVGGRTVPTYDKATMTPPAAPVADIPVRAADLPRAFAELYPGTIRPADARTGRIIADGRQAQVAHFLWNGYTTTVAFMAYAGSPAQRCRQDQSDARGSGGAPVTCTTRPDGAVLASGRGTADHDGGGVDVVNGAILYTRDHYSISVMSYNSASKTAPTLSAEPPLTVRQVTRAVTSRIWF